MELRVLQYFLAITREQSISGAAESLHLSQPTLSRQLKELEEELGKQLFIRGNRRISLTEEGMILRKRAEEVMDLIHKTEQEISVTDNQRILNAHDPGCHRGLHLRFLKSQEGYILTIPGQVFPFHRAVSRHHVLRMGWL